LNMYHAMLRDKQNDQFVNSNDKTGNK